MSDLEQTRLELSKFETAKHIHLVAGFLHAVVSQLLIRADEHDKSKLESPEVEAFGRVTHLLAETEYGSDEYRAALRSIKPEIKHHNEVNSHHPEHFPNGVAGMTLIDLVEMMCDWKAATYRMKEVKPVSGSLDKNAERFGIDGDLFLVLMNTAKWLDSFVTVPALCGKGFCAK